MNRLMKLCLALMVLGALGGTIHAQDTSPSATPSADAVPTTNRAGSPILPGSVASDTWVTTQDYVALRHGPGKAFGQITTVPAAVTIPAYGRTSDTSWIQVEYQGQRGWIAARYLVWTGDVINLPVDGINPEPFIRRAATVGILTRATTAFLNWADPLDRGIPIPGGTAVELTGRIGDDDGNYYGHFFRIQIRYQGVLYWVGSYDLRLVDGDYHRLLDLAYLFPYGKLYLALQDNLALAIGSYRQINDVWARLGSGAQVACDPIPPSIEKRITDADATREPTFIPAVAALGAAIDGINGAITAFHDACTNPSFSLTSFYIGVQTTALDESYRELIVAASLLEPLRVRNPLLDH